MKKCSLSFMFCCFISGSVFSQESDREAAKLLFHNVNTRLTLREKIQVYQGTGFGLSADKKQFTLGRDAVSAEFPFYVTVIPDDINADGKEDIFMLFGNSFTSGTACSNILLFIKNKAGNYQANFGFSGDAPTLLPTKHFGYPDILIGGPGIDFPAWRWNGNEYTYNRKISQKDLSGLKTISITAAGKIYAGTVKQ